MGLTDWLAQRVADWTMRKNEALVAPATKLYSAILELSISDAMAEAEKAVADTTLFTVSPARDGDQPRMPEGGLPPLLTRFLSRWSSVEDVYSQMRVSSTQLKRWYSDPSFLEIGTARGEHAFILVEPPSDQVYVYDPADERERLRDDHYPSIYHLLAFVAREARL